ncbi:MAG: hypothetical protein IT210_15645 [Armatimonadetes bacterium]|nr:hypothetical protein [Armatimonadota bacterium]
MYTPPDQGQYRVESLSPDYFLMLPQEAVRYSPFPDDLPHNAIWDFGCGPGDTMCAALCGELSAAVSVRLYRYMPDTGGLRFCFDGGPVTLTSPRMIPPSKIHTSIHPTHEGKVIMTTHTAARSQVHSHWMISFHFSDYLYAIDPATLKGERTGRFVPEEYSPALPSALKGMAFDGDGTLWYAVMWPSASRGEHTHLHRWDILRGVRPECLGMLGAPGRVTSCIGEMLMDRRDVLHIADTNHGGDPPGILAVDTRRLAELQGCARPQALDPVPYIAYPDGRTLYPEEGFKERAARYLCFVKETEEENRFITEQASTSVRADSASALRLWERLPRGEAAARALRWEESGDLALWCGGPGICRRLTIRNRTIIDIAEGDERIPSPEAAPEAIRSARLPWRQGRQHRARASCWLKWKKSQWLIGTEDGLLARFDEDTGKTFALGAVGLHGPVHQLTADLDCACAYGVSGDPNGLGHVFSYDDANGLREIGRTRLFPPDDYASSSAGPTAVALSPDGRTLAVGTADDLACLYLYENPWRV